MSRLFFYSCGLSVNRVILSDWTGPGSTKDSWDPLRDFWGSFQYFSKVCTICWIFKIPKDFFSGKKSSLSFRRSFAIAGSILGFLGPFCVFLRRF